MREQEIAIQEKLLDAQVNKQADADKYQKEINAAAELEQRKRKAEAERYEAEQKAAAVKAQAAAELFAQQQKAAGIEAVGKAEAAAIKAKGEAERFLSVYNAYKDGKEVTAKRLYLETMEQVLKNSDKGV